MLWQDWALMVLYVLGAFLFWQSTTSDDEMMLELDREVEEMVRNEPEHEKITRFSFDISIVVAVVFWPLCVVFEMIMAAVGGEDR